MARNLIIIGAGVAGIFAAATAASLGVRVILLEKMEKPLRKFRITGKGRCNITNLAPAPEFLAKVKSGAEFFTPALENFSPAQTIALLEIIGVPTVTERGNRVFPASSSAPLAAESLVRWARAQGVDIQCNSPVTSIAKSEEGKFAVSTKSAVYSADALLITTGGVSYPSTGSSGDGHQFAYDLGHNIVELRPSLVPLVVAKSVDIQQVALKNVSATLIIDGKEAKNRFGDVEFTDRGLAGAAILQLSRLAVDAILNNSKVAIRLDLKSALSVQKIIARIDRELLEIPRLTVAQLLFKMTPRAMHRQILNQSKLSANSAVATLSDNQKLALIDALKNLELPLTDYRSFSEAIVTAGGVDLSEVDCNTMQSKVVDNLYFAGEILDLDADTGGYNIQIAISTAILAAQSIAK